MELIGLVLVNPTTGALNAEWPVQAADIRASQRRREPRFPTNRLTVVYSTAADGAERMFCSILDVSQHGMRIRTARPLTIGTQVRITIRELSALGSVRYCNRVSAGYDHGICVEEVCETTASS
jgi:hypothetical protein